jgi:pyruvate ferredoxin oxidoreductase gamma subunit
LYVLNATKIAMETIGKPIANICVVGALSKVSGIVKKENLISTIKETLGAKFSEKVVNGNVNAALRGYNEVN